MATLAERVRGVALEGKWNNFLTKNREKALEQVAGLLNQAVHDDELNYQDARSDPERIIARGDLFRINLVLPEAQRYQAALIQRDNGVPGPIAEVLGDAGVIDVRGRLTTLCGGILKREDCDPVAEDSQAFFDELMSISVADRSRASNDGFRPSREQLNYYIALDRRSVPGAFSELSFDLDNVIPRQQRPGTDGPAQPATLMWKLSDGKHDVPVEYSILTLARVRSGDGFKDISAYPKLVDNYKKLTSNLERWREHARYYGVKPPPELSPGNGILPPAADASVNGSPAARPAATGGGA